jgi:hypothetical protein
LIDLRRSLVLVPLLVIPYLAGCSSTATKTVTQVATETASTASTPDEPAQTPEEFAVAYHDHINDRDFQWAWDHLDPQLQAMFGGHETWLAGYDYTASSKAVNVTTVDSSPSQTVLSFEVRSRDFDACDRSLDGRFSGTWTVAPDGTDFQVVDANFTRILGEAPITDAAACPGAAPVASPPAPVVGSQGSCDPNYVPCIPAYPPDLDCYDVGMQVEVVGSDPHFLDADGDGIGCELY